MLDVAGTHYCFVKKISKWVKWEKVSQMTFFLEPSEWRESQEITIAGIIFAFPIPRKIKNDDFITIGSLIFSIQI